MSPFLPALEAMKRSGNPTFGPVRFVDYLSEHFGTDYPRSWNITARWLSIQSLKGGSSSLDPALRDAGVMIFRLGTGTFALLKALALDDFFLHDHDLVAESEVFIPQCRASDLFPYQLMGTLVESNAVNLAITSGLLRTALDLDADAPRIGPTTGISTYSFSVRPHRKFPDLHWEHKNGQVEIDALYLAQREGRWTLFVIEAKKGTQSNSLPKHKLVYPSLAICSHPAMEGLGDDIEVVPVYMRAWSDGGHTVFRITECACDGLRTGESYISDLTPVRTRLLAVPETNNLRVGSPREDFK
jgi:hypothetical protein